MFLFSTSHQCWRMRLNDALALYLKHAPDLSAGRRRSYVLAVRTWQKFGGVDDIRRITAESFVTVRKAALDSGLRATTVEHYLSAISALLRHCGPRSGSCPHGLGMLREVPYIGRKLRQSIEIRPAVALDVLSEMYNSANLFEFAPGGVHRVTWWRCFLVLAYNTGLRIGDLLSLPWSAIVAVERKIVCRANKTGKIHELPINGTTARHLAMLPNQTETVLGTRPGQVDYIRAQLRRTCEAVGAGMFSPQAIRRRTACEFERAHPGSGALVLGHTLPSGLAVSFWSYINALEVVLRPAAEKIAQPIAFVESNE